MAKLMINYGDHKGRVRARTTVEYIDGSILFGAYVYSIRFISGFQL